MKILSSKLRKIFENSNLNYELLQEIRLRILKPCIIFYDGKEFFVSEEGELIRNEEAGYVILQSDIKEILGYISSFSLYAYEDEIRRGFITVSGGHRVGLAGKVIIEEGQIKSIKYISFINIRVSHEIKGCSEKIVPYLYEEKRICHTLIISPPGRGKTTILRDIARLISDGCLEYKGMSVGVVDERSEIAACFRGIPQNDVGTRTDVLDCCPKAEGMLMMIRSMSPAVIIVDEIGKKEDIEALFYVMNCGCKIIATVHGTSVDDIRNKPMLRTMVEENQFKRFVVLSGNGKPGMVNCIMDETGKNIGGFL